MAPQENQAAWLTAPGERLEVGSAPTPQPESDEVIIQVAYIGIAPSEWKVQTIPALSAFLQIPFPHVLGSDVAGVVVEVGSDVESVKVGDRVIG